jgi:hypothetical protein
MADEQSIYDHLTSLVDCATIRLDSNALELVANCSSQIASLQERTLV